MTFGMWKNNMDKPSWPWTSDLGPHPGEDSSNPFYDYVDLYLLMNRFGRRLLKKEAGTPLGLWPHVLHKVAGHRWVRYNHDEKKNYDDSSVLFEFVKELNSQVHLFNKAS